MADRPVNRHSSRLKKPSTDIQEITSYLETLFAQKSAEAQQLDPRYSELIDQIGILVGRGGKRMRPQLVLSSYEAFGGTDRRAIIQVAAGQELFHAFALMHDDIIDRDVVRWGGPNITGHYLKHFAKRLDKQDARHHADAWALLAGDLCLNLSFETLAESRFNSNRKLKALQLVQQTLFAMIGGELMDVSASIYTAPSHALDEEHFTRLYDAKTAIYSFSTPLRLGAVLAGASAAQDKQLKAFGYHLGIAFQLRDDILGIFGNEDQMGKSTLSDIREGRRTMLVSYGLQLAGDRQLRALESSLGNPKATYGHLKTVQEVLRVSGALAKTEAVMLKHTDLARAILLRAGFPMALSDYLNDLLAYSVKRSR